MRISGRPLHPAFSLDVSICSPSAVLGFSPTGSQLSLPESLKEAIDLSAKRSLASQTKDVEESEFSISSEPLSPPSEEPKDRGLRRSTLLKQSTFYIPPLHPKPSIRTARSMGSSQMRRAYTSATLSADAQTQVNSPATLSTKDSPNFRSPPSATRQPYPTVFRPIHTLAPADHLLQPMLPTPTLSSGSLPTLRHRSPGNLWRPSHVASGPSDRPPF